VFFQLGVSNIGASWQLVVPRGSAPTCFNGKLSVFEERVEYGAIDTQSLASSFNAWILNDPLQKGLAESLSIEISRIELDGFSFQSASPNFFRPHATRGPFDFGERSI
jgi:hypothetical protein